MRDSTANKLHAEDTIRKLEAGLGKESYTVQDCAKGLYVISCTKIIPRAQTENFTNIVMRSQDTKNRLHSGLPKKVTLRIVQRNYTEWVQTRAKSLQRELHKDAHVGF